MQKLIELFKKASYFLFPYFILLISAITILLIFSKVQIHIWVNQHWSYFGDLLFPKITFFGNGLFVIIVIVLLLFYKFGYSILFAVTYAISGLVVQLVKNLLFPHMQRPIAYLHNIYQLHLVQGVQMYSSKSFPSGHSATAFAFFLCFAFLTKNKYLQFLYFICACLIAYSRIYLSEHFLLDITTGSFIGTITTMVYYSFYHNYKAVWLNKSIITIIKK
jgi:membrane-associated phospholipid phosphatase